MGRISAAGGRGIPGWLGLVCGIWMLLATPARAQTIRELADLKFGTVVRDGSGTVTVSPVTGSATCGGAHTCMGGEQAAAYLVRGLGAQTYHLSYSSGDTLDRVAGGGSIPLQNLTDNVGGIVRRRFFGMAFFRVGGELVLDAQTPDGDYLGNLTITLTAE